MTKSKPSQVRFLLTRVAVGGTAVGAFLGLWAALAVSASAGAEGADAPSDIPLLDTAAEVQPSGGATAPVGGPGPVIVIERQVVYYIVEAPAIPGVGQPPVSDTSPTPSGATLVAAGPSASASPSIPAPVSAASPAPALPVASPGVQVPLPVPQPPAAPAAAGARVQAPVAPPKPAANSSKKSKGS